MNVNTSPIRICDKTTRENLSELKRSVSRKILEKVKVSDQKMPLKEKIKEIFHNELEEMIESILIDDTEDFLKNLKEKIRRNMNDQDNMVQHSEFNDLFNEYDTMFVDEVFHPLVNFLSKAYENFEFKLRKSNQKINTPFIPKIIESVSYLTKFKRHCAKTKEALHSCGEKLLEIYSEKSRDHPKFFLCFSCKKVYTNSQILLFCEHCDTDYLTCYIDSDNKADLEIHPATWDKYHCDAIVNEQMRCIKCKEIFYLNCLTGNLECKNVNCKITLNPNTIGWKCMFCKDEFTSDAKVYNTLEFKNVKNSIKNTIYKRIPARPQIRPCCGLESENKSQDNVWNNVNECFKHKKDCDGNLFLGNLNRKQIVVCEKCKSMNFYEKFTWTCPVCQKRFRQKASNSQSKQQTNNRTPIRVSHSNYNSNGNSEYDSNSKLGSAASKDIPQIRPPKYEFNRVNINLNSDKLKEHSPRLKHEQTREGGDSKFFSDCPKRNDQEQDARKDRQQYQEVKKCLMNEYRTEDTDSNKVNITNINLINIINLNNQIDNKNLIDKLKATPDLREITRKLSFSKAHVAVAEIPKVKNQNDLEEKRFSTPNFKRKSSGTVTTKQEVIKSQNSFNLNLDDFEIIKQIGEGSFGIIYSVHHKVTKEKYAMKKIIAHSEKEINIFKQEYALMNSITDDPKNKYCRKHVLKIFGTDVKKLDSTTFALYVFSELANADWEKEIKYKHKTKKFYTEDELLDILKITVRTLAEMQRENISHRDIKPQNVLIFNRENIIYKIADFGEAKEMKISKQQLNTLKGTEMYMSPILFFSLRNKTNNSAKINHNPFKSDLFSLGLCMLLASTLTFNSLCEIRELQETKLIAAVVNKYLRGKYSSKFISYIVAMLEYNESQRLDFIQFEELMTKY